MYHASGQDVSVETDGLIAIEIDTPAEAAAEKQTFGKRDEMLMIAFDLRFILMLIALATAQAILPRPSVQFIQLSFFAEGHGGGDCANAPSSDPCRQASSDNALYHGVAGAIAHSFAWLSALVLGSYSDRTGRRPLLVAKGCLSLLSVLSLATHILGGVTLWLFLVLEPTLTIFDVHSVFFAATSDVIRDPKQRVTAYSMVMGAAIASGGIAGAIGSQMTAKAAVTASILLGSIHVLFVVVGFPETAPMQHQLSPSQVVSWQRPSLVAAARDSVRLLRRDSVIRRMTLVLMFSSFSATGFHSIFVPYLTAYMGFDKSANGRLLLVCGVSVVSSFVFAMNPLLTRFGEFGMMRICLSLKVLFYFCCAAAWNRTQLFVVHGLLVGPVVLIFPIMHTIQSNLVGPEEQGRMQGVLAACKVFAHAVGDIFFGWFYTYATNGGTDPNRLAVLPPLLTSASLAVVAAMIAWTLNPIILEHGDAAQKAISEMSV